MKKILSLFLALVLLVSLAGCHVTPAPTAPDAGLSAETTLPPQTTAPDPTDGSTETPTTEEVTEPETTQTPTEPEATQKPTDPPATQKPTDPPATQKPTDPPATTQKPTEPETSKAPSQSQKTVDAAFALSTGQSLSGTVTLTGKVTSVSEISSYYGNATFSIQVEGSDGKKTLLCFRVTPTDENAMDVAVGDTVTLTGTIQNYKGTIEFYPADYTNLSYDPTQSTTPPTTSGGTSSGKIDKNGVYDSKDEVALYIHTYGCLPSNYITKSQAKAQNYPSNKCCGGDRFYNKEGLLPEKSGRVYYECDIDTLGRGSNRGTKRIVYSNDGLIYYTSNHYASFTLLYGTP